jgi:hypothetical protein
MFRSPEGGLKIDYVSNVEGRGVLRVFSVIARFYCVIVNYWSWLRGLPSSEEDLIVFIVEHDLICDFTNDGVRRSSTMLTTPSTVPVRCVVCLVLTGTRRLQ